MGKIFNNDFLDYWFYSGSQENLGLVAALSNRASLRSLPKVLDKLSNVNEDMHNQCVLLLFRAILVSKSSLDSQSGNRTKDARAEYMSFSSLKQFELEKNIGVIDDFNLDLSSYKLSTLCSYLKTSENYKMERPGEILTNVEYLKYGTKFAKFIDCYGNKEIDTDISIIDISKDTSILLRSPIEQGDLEVMSLNNFLNSLSHDFDFWKTWTKDVYSGRLFDWRIQREVALIDDSVWTAGPKAVAEEITRIQASFLAQTAPQAETIELNPETNRFRAVPIPTNNPKLLAATLSQVSDALDDTLSLPSNGLTERSRETRVIQRVVSRYGNDPQRVEMDFTSVASGLRRQIHETEDLPPTEDNLALLGAVEDAVLAIRETHPEVAENRATLAKAKLKELSEEDKQALADAAPTLIEISEGALAEDFINDIPAMTGATDDWRPIPATDGVTRQADGVGSATARTASRTAKIWEHLDRSAENLEWVLNGKPVQAAALTILLKDVIQIFLRVFGVI
ncbi:MAG: hypothetical protein ACPGGK_17360 [Pikeienuella sp.]